MGGKLAIIARYKDKTTIAFKIHTSFLNYNLNTPKILDESWLKKLIIEHDLLHDNTLTEESFDNYENDKAIKAPYYYGIVLIDYYNCTLASENDYDSMIKASSANIDMQYLKALSSNFKAGLKQDEKITYFNLKEDLFFEEYAAHYIDYALRHNAIIRYKNNTLQHNGTIESVVGAIYNLSLEGKSKEQQKMVINNYLKEQDDKEESYYSLNNYNDVTFEYQNWTIIENINSRSDINAQIIYDYMIENSFDFSELEKITWQAFINERKQREDKHKEN